jgi:hypothetical protein
VVVSFVPLVPEAEAELQARAETANWPPADEPPGGEIGGRVVAPGSAGLRELLPAVTGLIERERMEVNLPSAAVSHDEPRRQSRCAARVVFEAVLLQSVAGTVERRAVESEVEVGVRSSFLAEESVDSPTAVHDDVDSRRVQPAQQASTSCAVMSCG